MRTALAASGWRFAVLALLGLLLAVTLPFDSLRAAEPPPGMTREQFEAVVTAVADTLARSLGRAPAEQPGPGPGGDAVDVVAQRVTELVQRIPRVFGAMPELPAQSLRVLSRFDRTAAGGLGAGAFLALLAGSVAAALGAGMIIRMATAPLARHLAGHPGQPLPILRVVALAGLDGLALAGVWMVTRVTLGSLFFVPSAQTIFAASVLEAVVMAAGTATLFEIWMRPRLPAARIVPVDDDGAAQLKRLFTLAVVVVVATRCWLGLLATPFIVSAGMLLTALAVTVTYGWVLRRGRHALGAWIAGLASPSPGGTALERSARAVQRVVWPVIGLILVLRLYAALSGRAEVPLGTMATSSTIILLLLAESLVCWLLRHPSLQQLDGSPAIRLVRSATRLARLAVLLLASIALVRVWSVDALGLLDEVDWRGVSRALWAAAICAFVGACVWEAVRVATDPYLTPSVGGRMADPEEAGRGAGSRARTLAPLLRVAALVVITGATVLAILSALGVNITPLIAGASIIGLAISFGSQTLVRDIVSGVFYLAEDAFRVGEYIDCGKAKGTVEGFALRSLKLRHQNGQLHTIPFGQLGQVTNFSRDWSTVKFNLRFARHTDLEQLRKATKKIGQGLAEDPAFAEDFLEPLKMQGVVEILDEALVARFKFTVRPLRPPQIQREAIRRLLRDLPAAGIRFPTPTVSVIAVSPEDAAAVRTTAAAARMDPAPAGA